MADDFLFFSLPIVAESYARLKMITNGVAVLFLVLSGKLTFLVMSNDFKSLQRYWRGWWKCCGDLTVNYPLGSCLRIVCPRNDRS